jgi:tetratricopeptide (TPR) repeat protein
MPRQAIKTSPAMARYLRDCRKKAGLTLREVQQLTAEGGEGIPSSTVCKIEQGKVEPGLVRVRQLLEVYRKPLHQAADLLDLEELIAPPPEGTSAEALYERGMALLKEGRIREGLGYLLPLRPAEGSKGPISPISQRALITLSIGLQRVGKHRLALAMIEKLLADASRLDATLMLHAHVQAGKIWLDLGSAEIALAFFGRAREHLAEDDIKGEAWILGNEANVLALDKRWEDAIEKVGAAAGLMRRSGDLINLIVSYAQLTRFKLLAGDAEGALATAREGLEVARDEAYESKRNELHLWEGRALVALGQSEEGLEVLKKALSSAVERDDLNLQFMAHFHLWKAHAALGNSLRAQFELGAARSYLRHSDEDSEEAREIRQAAGEESWTQP